MARMIFELGLDAEVVVVVVAYVDVHRGGCGCSHADAAGVLGIEQMEQAALFNHTRVRFAFVR